MKYVASPQRYDDRRSSNKGVTCRFAKEFVDMYNHPYHSYHSFSIFVVISRYFNNNKKNDTQLQSISKQLRHFVTFCDKNIILYNGKYRDHKNYIVRIVKPNCQSIGILTLPVVLTLLSKMQTPFSYSVRSQCEVHRNQSQ